MQRVLDEVRKRGGDAITSFVSNDPKQQIALAMYKRLGFKIVREETKSYLIRLDLGDKK